MCMTIAHAAPGLGGFVATDTRVYTSAGYDDRGGKIVDTGIGWAVASGEYDPAACVLAALRAAGSPPPDASPGPWTDALVRGALAGSGHELRGWRKDPGVSMDDGVNVHVIAPWRGQVGLLAYENGQRWAARTTTALPFGLPKTEQDALIADILGAMPGAPDDLATRITLAARFFARAAHAESVSPIMEVGYLLPVPRGFAPGFLRGPATEIADSDPGDLFARFAATCDSRISHEIEPLEPVHLYRTATGEDVDANNTFDMSREDTDDLTQGASRRLTDAAYLDANYRPSKGVDGFQFDGDAYIPDTAAPLVGTSGSPSSLTKTLRIAASALVPRDHTETFTFDTTGYLYPGDTTLRSFFGAVALPVGVTITEVAANGYRAGTGDSLIVYFHRRTGDGAYSTLATLTHSTTGWQTVTSSISEGISSSYFYTFRVNLNANTSPADVRFDHIRITYTMPSYDKGI